MKTFSKTSRRIAAIFAALVIALAPVAAAHAADLQATITPSGVSFTENAQTPAFTVTTPRLTTSTSFQKVNLSIMGGEFPAPFVYWAVNPSCNAQSTSLADCKISSVQVDGSPVTGVSASKGFGDIVILTFSSALPSGSDVSVSFDGGAFTAGPAGTYDLLVSPGGPGIDPATSDSASVTLTSSASGGGGSSTPTASITLGAAQGQLVAGSSVAIVASGLQASAPYSVTVQSNPQLLTPANATATNGAVNTTVTLPSNLGPGWHTLTFSSTAADGSAVTSVLYFEVSSTGTLLGTSTTKPAALAQTGFVDSPLVASGAALLILGAATLLFARRRWAK